MIDEYIGARRNMPLHRPVQLDAEAQNTQQKNGLQLAAPARSDLPTNTDASDDYFTISVEQVRDHLRSKGLHKSKDTVQRWC